MQVDRWHLSNQLFFYDISTNEWVWPAFVTGELPTPRCEHHTIISGNTVFTFGGWALPRYPTDLCMLDMKGMRWSRVDADSLSQGVKFNRNYRDIRKHVLAVPSHGWGLTCLNL